MGVYTGLPARDPKSRRASVIAAVVPLAMCTGFWFLGALLAALDPPLLTTLQHFVNAVARSALGPFSTLFAPADRSTELPLLALAVWSAYLLLVAKTKLGRAHWVVFFLGGSLWCVVGTSLTMSANVRVTQ
jgi:hypothetical protein